MALMPKGMFEKIYSKKPKKPKKVKVPEGYEKCPECDGVKFDINWGLESRCSYCKGVGYVDWVTNILGPNRANDLTDDHFIPGAGGSHSHHTHMHGITGPGQIGSIVGGPGVTVQHNNCYHVNSSQSAMCSSTISVSDPTLSLDFDYIKEELKDWIEEHIKNEVSKRLQDELMRRGVK